MALYNEACFSTYARPGEMLKMKAADFVPANKAFHHAVLVVAPFERGEGSKTGEACGDAAEAGGRNKHVEFFRIKVLGSVAQVRGGAGHSGPGSQPVPESAWGSFAGSSPQAPLSPSDPKEGSLGGGLQCQNLRQAREAPADDQQVQRPLGGIWGASANRLSPLVPRWCLPSPSGIAESMAKPCQGKAFLSLFGGAAEIAKTFARRGGTAAVIDLTDAAVNDLSSLSSWNRVLSVIQDFDFVGIDLPCNTWSRARRAPTHSRMPSALP